MMSIHEIHVFEWDWNELSGNDPCRYECHSSSSEKSLKNAFFRPFLLLPKHCFQPWGSFNFQTLIIIKIIVIITMINCSHTWACQLDFHGHVDDEQNCCNWWPSFFLPVNDDFLEQPDYSHKKWWIKSLM